MVPPQLNYTSSMKVEPMKAECTNYGIKNPENKMMNSSDGYQMIGSGDVRVIESDGVEEYLKNAGIMEIEHNHVMMNSVGRESSKMSKSNDMEERFERKLSLTQCRTASSKMTGWVR